MERNGEGERWEEGREKWRGKKRGGGKRRTEEGKWERWRGMGKGKDGEGERKMWAVGINLMF